MSIVATGAMQFDAKDLNELHTIEDIKKPEYAKVVKKLNEIRSENEGVAYAWLMRPTGKQGYWEYIADADSLDPFAAIDSNYDGEIDSTDQLQYPGYQYEEFDPYMDEALISAFSTPEINTDNYGTYITTSAPIRDLTGKTIGIVGIDILIHEIKLMTWHSFNYIFCFFGIFIIFVLLRMFAFNRKLLKEIFSILRSHKLFLALALCAEVAYFVTLGMYFYTLNNVITELGDKLTAIILTAAPEINVADINQLHIASDMRKPEYQRVFNKLNEIRNRNITNNIQYAYIMRPTPDPEVWEFVADADSNFNIPLWTDFNENGIQETSEESVAPGEQYFSGPSDSAFNKEGIKRPIVEVLVNDQWGTLLSASTPILDEHKRGIAILGLDMDISDVYKTVDNRFIPWMWFFGIFGILTLTKIGIRVL